MNKICIAFFWNTRICVYLSFSKAADSSDIQIHSRCETVYMDKETAERTQ